MRSPTSRTPIAQFPLPAEAPQAVADAAARFEQLADQWATLRGEISDAREGAAKAKADAIRMAADQYAAGETPVDVKAVELAEAARIEAMRAQLEALGVALDEAGNELAAEIAAHREEWVAALEPAAAAAASRYDAAIREAQEALRELGPALRAVSWLREFDAGEARVGAAVAFLGGRIILDHRFIGSMRNDYDAAEVLAAAAKATAPPKVEVSRRHKVAAR